MRFIPSSADLGAGVVLSPHDVELELVHVSEQISATNELLVRYSEELEARETDLELALAKGALRSKERSQAMRQAEALENNEELVRQVRKLKQQVRTCRETGHNLRAELESVRSIGASVRATFGEGQGSGSGGSGQRR